MPNVVILKNCPGKGLCGRCFICLRSLPSYDPILPPLAPPYHSWASAFRILYLSPVPENSGTGMGPLIPVPDWFRIVFFVHSGTRLTGCHTASILALIKTYTLHVHIASDGLG
jgi:hypothetical protein